MSEAATYETFPITLAHPAFAAAKSIPVPGSEVRDGLGNIVRQDYRGTPERFPPVTVNSTEEEEYYLAQGYERAGKVDPSAWVRAHSDAPPEDYKPQSYPMWRDGVLYLTAQEDPGASEEDLTPPEADEPDQVAEEAPQQVGEVENLRATLDQMNATMKAMAEQMAEAKADASRHAADAAELRALLDQATAPAAAQAPNEPAEQAGAAQERRAPGRPRRAA